MIWKHRETGAIAVSGQRFIAADYRTAVSLAKSMSKWTGNATVYVFKTVESTLTGIVWRYSLVEPPSREVVGKVHRVAHA